MGDKPGRKRSDEQPKRFEESLSSEQRAFLAAFREMGVIKRACEVAEVGRTTHYEWLERIPGYREAYDAAKEDAADNLEAEVYRRAVKGVRKPVGWYMGKAGGYVREYSDVLLIFYLKGLRPEKFRERVDIRGTLAHVDLSQLSDALLARIAAGEHPFSVLAPGQEGVRMLEPGELKDGRDVTQDTSHTADDGHQADEPANPPTHQTRQPPRGSGPSGTP